MIYLFLTATFLVGGLGFGFSQNNDWNQFRGQTRSGGTDEVIGEISWLENEPELLWRKEIGSAFSELVISNQMIYTLASEQIDSVSGNEFVIAFNEETGEEVWRTKIDSIFIDVDGWGNGPRSTPSIDDNHVYCLSAHGKLSAHSRKDGEMLWQVNFPKDYSSTLPRWGYSSSPLLFEDKLIVEVGGTDSRAFMCFDKKDGKVIWSKAKGNASYNSPLLATIQGQAQFIFMSGRTLYSYHPNGDTLWTYKMPLSRLSAMPVLIDEDKIFVSGVRSVGFAIVQIKDNVAKEVLRGNSMKNDFNSCSYYNGHIYGFHVAALRCISAETGDVKWTKRGYGKGSLIRVDGQLLVLSDKGKLILVDTDASAYKEKGSVQAIHGKSWTAPSFSNGKVYVRNRTEMACYKLK